MKNRVDGETEKSVLKYVIDFPAYGKFEQVTSYVSYVYLSFQVTCLSSITFKAAQSSLGSRNSAVIKNNNN